MFFSSKLKVQEMFESYRDIKNKEYADLLVQYRLLNETLNVIDGSSERFDATCLELKATNHRIAAVKKEILELEGSR